MRRSLEAEYEHQKRRVRKIFDRWRDALGLGWWKIDLNWSYDLSEFKQDNPDLMSFAYVVSNWEYQTASITLNMHMLAERSDEELENDVLHELVHIPLFMMDPEQKDFVKHREWVVVRLTSMFQWARRAGFEEGKRAGLREAKKEAKGVANGEEKDKH